VFLMSGLWLAGRPFNVLPGTTIQHLHIPSEMTTRGFFWASIVVFFGFATYGIVGRIMGRRPVIIMAGLIVLIAASLLCYAKVVHATTGGSAVGTTVLAAAFHVMVLSPWGIVTTYICERFPTRVRASGYGIGYSVAIIIPSFSAI
jgi:hypothetical protein